MPDSDREMLPVYPDLECFREHENTPEIIPGRATRDWMDETNSRFAYRCTPLPIANSSGWEIIMPFSIAAHWNGGNLPTDVVITSDEPGELVKHLAVPAFGHGILTFHPGYLFRTSPGWAIAARGAPNTVKDGITALEGLVETDWLPFTFTMNWRFTRPGTVHFEKGEAFCFLSLVPHAALDHIQPRLRTFDEAEELKQSFEHWRKGRNDFHARLAEGDPETVKQGWQRDYVKGRDPSGRFEPDFHLSRRRLKSPI
ncbi:DUF6065 family protein [Cognatiyoonia sp. IB215446]|uniref:DUF6065 family protein n=1 Tax=Cognatiyoonia sp. IB215446 TaxID=3097355 RepID=UPI002A1358D1|nr:DUF6065 family protein [Cognatiyoonia sp. IB215446]MDX8347951.1 DUF6065 family protein [Cognatiyoonia sp. IB215446]